MNDHHFLTLAAQAAAAVDPHHTRPNPRVGCLVVKGGEVIATGVHEARGGPHAEAAALAALSASPLAEGRTKEGFLKDCTLYLTLEPCVAFTGKKTPPCSDLLLELKPERVVVGALDAHFPGRGIETLQAGGVKAKLVETEHHAQLNPWYHTWHQQQRPFVTLKIAQSLDGKITGPQSSNSAEFELKYITNELSRVQVHLMRATHAAILTTTATVLADDPLLNTRLQTPLAKGESEAQPSQGDFNHSPFTIHPPPSSPDIIIMGQSGLPASLKLHQITGRKIHHLQTHDFNQLLSFCREHGYSSLLTECGGTMNSALLAAGLVDQIELFTAPVHLGDSFTPSFTEEADLSDFKLIGTHAKENDIQLTYRRLSS